MSVEFKIFGDLTIRQFIYISIAGGLAFIFYLIYLPGLIKWTLITISILLGILVTFAKINERPFDEWINSFITAIMLPTQRVWKKTPEVPFYLQSDVTAAKTGDKKQSAQDGYNRVLTYIHSRKLPTDEMYKSNTRLDIEEIKMLTGIDKMLYANETVANVRTYDAVSQLPPSILTRPTQPIDIPDLIPPFGTLIPPQKQNTNPNPANPAQVAPSTPSPVIPDPIPSLTPIPDPTPVVEIPEAQPAIIPEVTPETTEPEETQTPEVIPEVVPEEMPESVSPIIPQTELQPDVPFTIPQTDTGKDQDPFTNPADEEYTSPPAEEVKPKEAADDIFTIEPNTVIKLDDLKGLSSSTSELLDQKLKAINEEKEIKMPEAVLKTDDASVQTQLLQTLREENELLKEQLSKLNQTNTPSIPSQQSGEPIQEAVTESRKIYGHMPDFVRYPNIISGVVVDSNEKLVEDVVVILKDKSKRIMRAMKTNILGQFYSRNPLPNGTYDVEANKEGFIFQTLSVDLKGVILDPVVIAPKKFDTIPAGEDFNMLNKTSNGK